MEFRYDCWVGEGKLGVAAAAMLQMNIRGEDVTAYSLAKVIGVSAPTARKRIHQICERGGVTIKEEKKGNHFRRVYIVPEETRSHFAWYWSLKRQVFTFGEGCFDAS